MRTTITNVADVKSVATTLHDARFMADAIEFDSTAKMFALKCWVLERKPKKLGASQCWHACRLSFTSFADCKVNEREKVPYYELATLRFAEGQRRLDLITHYGIEVSLAMEHLDGALTETSETREKWG